MRIYNETPSGTVGSGNTIFTVATAYITGSSVVTRDGLVMKPGGVDYTETPSTGTVTFVTAPVAGSTILVSYSRTVGQDVQQLIRQDYVTGTPSGTYSGSTTVFDLPFTYTPGVGSLLVYSSGVLMLAGAGNDYVETDSDTITFNSARTASEKIQFIKIGISADYGNSVVVNSATTNQLAKYSSSTNIVGDSNLTVNSGNSLTIQSISNPLKTNSTFAGGAQSGGRVGTIGVVHFWDPSGGSAAKDYSGLANNSMRNSIGVQSEFAEIGMVMVDNVEATATAHLLFLMRGAGETLPNGAYARLAPIGNSGAYLRLGNGEEVVETAPTIGGGFMWSDSSAMGGFAGGVQYGGGTTFTARSTGAAFIEFGRDAVGDVRIYTNNGLTAGNTYTPTARLQITTTAITTNLPTAIKGTTTNDSAASLYVGEYVESVVSDVAFAASTTYGDLTSISLTAGDWDVVLLGNITNGNNTMSSCLLGISTTSGNSGTGLVIGSNRLDYNVSTATGIRFNMVIPLYRISLSTTTTVYAKDNSNYAGTAPVFTGRLSARRVR